jgi:hypothetical protein
VGIQKNVNIGGNLSAIEGTLTTLQVISTSNATDTQTGVLVVSGGQSIAKDLYVGGIGHYVNTTNATDTNTGSVILSGGVSIQKDVHIGGSLTGTSGILNDISVVSTTNATDTQTGVVKVAGGASVVKDVYIGGNTTSTTLSVI